MISFRAAHRGFIGATTSRIAQSSSREAYHCMPRLASRSKHSNTALGCGVRQIHHYPSSSSSLATKAITPTTPIGTSTRKQELSTASYGDSWETFWGSVSEDDPQDVLWNASHDQAVAIDWEYMKDYFVDENKNDTLPLVDVGCGDGTQTCFFGKHIPRTVGVDISAAAIEIANKTINNNNGDGSGNSVTYQVLDLLDTAACQTFRDSIGGDANIYMRGVLMQFASEDRGAATDNLKMISGSTGCLYLHEYAPQTKAYYGSIFQKQGMPMGFKRVLDSGITPGGIARDEMDVLFAGYNVLKESDQHTMSTIIELKGEKDVARAPGFYMILKKKN